MTSPLGVRGEVPEKMTFGDMGEGVVQKGRKKGDIIYEQPLITYWKLNIIFRHGSHLGFLTTMSIILKQF